MLLTLPFKSYVFYGHNVPLREICAYADVGLKYQFSGITIHPHQWIPLIYNMKRDVESFLNTSFNFALLNYYVNGKAYISPHKDDEPCLDVTAPIACLSFGATRALKLNKVKTVYVEGKSLYVLNSYDLVHEIPVEKNVTDPRISITFRRFKK